MFTQISSSWAARNLVAGGLMFYCRCFLFSSFFRQEISELRRPIAAKLCHVIGRFFRMII